jgi:hypothetical protein
MNENILKRKSKLKIPIIITIILSIIIIYSISTLKIFGASDVEESYNIKNDWGNGSNETTPTLTDSDISDPMNELDGKLSPIYQGDVGDCGAISAIQALDNSLFGKNLLSTIITVENDGYTLNFGSGEQYVTKTEVDNGYVKGDLDAKVIEVGLNKAMSIYNGCFACDVFEIMTGYSQNTVRDTSTKSDMMNFMLEKCTSGEGITAACDFSIADSSKGIIGDGGHSYSIKNVTSDTVIIVNPWDTSEDVSLSRTQFENSIRYMCVVNVDSGEIDVFWN